MKSYLTKTLLILSIAGNNAQAFDSIVLEKGQSAPFSGVLLSNETANTIRYQLIERDTFEKLNLSYERSLTLMKGNESLKDEQIKLLMDSNITLSRELTSRSGGTWERIAWFALGVLATSVAVYGTKKITN